MVDEIEQFVTGARHRAEPDRALVTTLFTDMVSSTERAAELGDERWSALVDRHDEITRTELERYGGRAVKTLGDGFLAAFEGLPRRFAARGRSARRSGRSGSSCGRAFTPASASAGG
jgi:class 3 adenylate cyclase